MAFVAIIGVLLIGLAVLLAQDGPSAGIGADVVAEAGTTSTVLAVEPVPTEPPVTAAPVTPAPVVDEIIPGFPRTNDLQVFLQQLEANPALVGPAGPQLTESLAEMLGEKANKQQRERAADLGKEITEWVEDGQLDPSIAQALVDLLAPMYANGNSDDD